MLGGCSSPGKEHWFLAKNEWSSFVFSVSCCVSLVTFFSTYLVFSN